jgi:outer membrane protein OmpA-like peptidoglycan-associated protein
VHEDQEAAVLAALARIDELREGGVAPDRIAATMVADGAPVPGGGTWSPAKVERIIGVFESMRRETSSPDPATSDPATPDLATPDPVAADLATPDPVPTSKTGGPEPETPRPPEVRRAAERPADEADHGPAGGVGQGAIAVAADDPVVDGTADRPDGSRFGPLAALRWAAIGAAMAGLGAGGFLAMRALLDEPGTTTDLVADDDVPPSVPATTATTSPTTATTAPPDPADMMAIRVETDRSTPVGELSAATASIRVDGRLYVEGAFATRSEATAFVERAGSIFGSENIVEDYVIDPAAPAPPVGDVALDKPVLFTTGTAEIDPDYIPFLEACAGVLELNPHIVMSISAYTDSLGDDQANLELSQRRAQAIVDFYQQREIADDQLTGVGLGEADPVADNSTAEGRSRNRRAMLQLLNAMAEDGDGGG